MTSRGGHSGRRKPSLKIPQTGGAPVYVERQVIDQIKEVTKATEEDIQLTLTECSGDVNEATARLIDSKRRQFVVQSPPFPQPLTA